MILIFQQELIGVGDRKFMPKEVFLHFSLDKLYNNYIERIKVQLKFRATIHLVNISCLETLIE